MSTAVVDVGSRTRSVRRRVPGWAIAVAVIVSLVVLVLALAPLLNEPLRRRMEATLNANLQGYTARLPGLEIHPFALSLSLIGLKISQNAHPEPPMITIERMTPSVHWRALLNLRLVADLQVNNPRLHVDRTQLASEATDDVAIQDKGWQGAIESIYPLKFNQVTITNGAMTYIDDPRRPIELSDIEVTTTNIRNARSDPGTFPSPLRVRATVFDRGRIAVDGAADYLARPNPAVHADIDLDGVPLERVAPVADEVNVQIRGGVLSAKGDFESVGERQHAHLSRATIDSLAADYVHQPRTAEAKRAEQVAEATADLAQAPGIRVDVEELLVSHATLGVIDKTTSPNYRVFIDEANMRVLNVSNQPAQGRGWVMLDGRFMGSGASQVWTSFVSDKDAGDANIALQINDTDMRSMNDLFRAQGDFDVVGGRFSFFSELYLNGGRIDGYIKPLFADVDVYDSRQERGDSLGHKVYEGLVGGVAALLENRYDETATRARISGKTDAPRLSTWQIIVNLVGNAFFKAIMPGLEHASMGTRAATVIGDEPSAKPEAPARRP